MINFLVYLLTFLRNERSDDVKCNNTNIRNIEVIVNSANKATKRIGKLERII
jgi:hypothetical protein